MARTQRRLRLPSDLNSRIGTPLDDFIRRSLSDAADRFSSALEMHKALIQLRTGGKRTSTAKESLYKSKGNSNAWNAGTAGGTDNTADSNIVLPTATEETLTGNILDEQNSNSHGSNGDVSDYEQRIDEIVSTDTVFDNPSTCEQLQCMVIIAWRGTSHPGTN